MTIIIQKPTIGRVVEYSMKEAVRYEPNGDKVIALVSRPALVVSCGMGGDDGVNLQVFLDGDNDRRHTERDPQFDTPPLLTELEVARGWAWRTSIHYDADGKPGTWRYPPRNSETIELK